MRKIKFLTMLVLCVLAFGACKKSSSNPTPSQSISLKFNGTVKSSTSVVASSYTSENTLQLLGTFGTEAVSLMIQNPKVGTFDASTDEVVATYSTSANFADTFLGSSGTVIINSLTSDNVSGTFQFTGTNQSNLSGVVTEGKLSAKLFKVQQL